jgi:hypothetical protein
MSIGRSPSEGQRTSAISPISRGFAASPSWEVAFSNHRMTPHDIRLFAAGSGTDGTRFLIDGALPQ